MRRPAARLSVRWKIALVAITALMLWRYDWALLGPILLIMDVSPEYQAWGVGLSLVLAPCILAGIVWPRPWSVLLGVVAALAWLLVGILGIGILC